MTLNVLLPLLSSLVSFVFAALVLMQWAQRRRSFQLIWAIGLLWYGVSAGTEFWGSAFGWNEPLYRTWYLIGAFYVAAWLGMGTVALLARTRFGYFVAASLLLSGLITLAAGAKYQAPATSMLAAPIVGAALVAGSVVVAVLVLTAPIASPGYALDHVTGVPVGEAMPAGLRPLTIPFNVGGALALVCGAVFSAYVYMPKRKLLRARALPPVVAQLYGTAAIVVNLLASLPAASAALARGELHSRVPATLLIALGGFIPGLTSGLNRFGITWSFFLGELIGVLLIFAGFLVSTEVFGRATRVGPLAVGRSGPARTTS